MSQYTANKYPGKCCYCGQPVGPHAGILVRASGKFAPAHKECDPERYAPDPIDTRYEDDCREVCGL